MSSISVAGDTSGSVTLSAPAVAGTTVLTLPAVSGTLALTASPSFTGNITMSTADAGIVFNKTSSLINSTLNDYETGTWTPVLNPAVGTITSSVVSGTYTKVGKLVTVNIDARITGGTITQITSISGFPFINSTTSASGIFREYYSVGTSWAFTLGASSQSASIISYNNTQTCNASYGWNGSISYVTAS